MKLPLCRLRRQMGIGPEYPSSTGSAETIVAVATGRKLPLAQQPPVSLLTQVRERVPDSSLPVIINVPRLPAYRFNCPDKRLISPTPCVLQSPLYVPCRPPMARLGPDEYTQQCLSFTLIVESVAARRDPQRRSDHGWNRGLVG